jgi:hypothetical protein
MPTQRELTATRAKRPDIKEEAPRRHDMGLQEEEMPEIAMLLPKG